MGVYNPASETYLFTYVLETARSNQNSLYIHKYVLKVYKLLTVLFEDTSITIKSALKTSGCFKVICIYNIYCKSVRNYAFQLTIMHIKKCQKIG